MLIKSNDIFLFDTFLYSNTIENILRKVFFPFTVCVSKMYLSAMAFYVPLFVTHAIQYPSVDLISICLQYTHYLFICFTTFAFHFSIYLSGIIYKFYAIKWDHILSFIGLIFKNQIVCKINLNSPSTFYHFTFQKWLLAWLFRHQVNDRS